MKIFYFLKNLPSNVHEFIQRGKRGYSDFDVYDFRHFFEELIPKAISQLDMKTISYPAQNIDEIESFEKDWIDKNFKEIIDDLKQRGYKDEFTLKDNLVRFRLILRRIAWDFKEQNYWTCSKENEYGEEFSKMFISSSQNLKPNSTAIDSKLKKKYFDREKEIDDYIKERRKEGFELLNKYFDDLWY